MLLIFEWDAEKADANRRKHRVGFEEARTVFNDPLLVSFPDEYHSETEQRLISIGAAADGRILLVVHTEMPVERNAALIRLISARKATASERRVYEEK
jgi:uncharacterized DUF497 family protein